MPSNGKIPATVLTGFLGAGKTSTIRHLLENANGKRLALIINEFGDLGVDGEIVKGCGIEGCDEEDVMELANGCICCTVADDFLPTMEAILSRDEPPDHIVIETSGLALPKPLVKAFNWPEVRSRVTVDGVVALVDGPAVADGLFAHDPGALDAEWRADPALDHESPLEELFEEQLGAADMVLVNKTDQMAAPALEKAVEMVKSAVRPGVRLVKAEHGRVDTEVLLGLEAAAESDLDSRPSHHDGADHEHDHDDFESFAVSLAEISSPDEILDRLQALVQRHEILRVKGFAAVDGKPMRCVIQGVGARLSGYYDRPWRAEETRRTELVVIGLCGLDQAAIRAALAE